jgi:hypothetical protein
VFLTCDKLRIPYEDFDEGRFNCIGRAPDGTQFMAKRPEWITLEPCDIMFHPPWDSGEYST